MPVAQLVEYLLVDIAVQSTDAYPCSKRVLPCRCQSSSRGVPVHDDLVLDVGGKGVIAADLQRPAFCRLIVVVYLLPLVRRVPQLVIVAVVMEILPAPYLVVDRLAAAAQLPGDVADRLLLVQQRLQDDAFLFRHVVSHESLPYVSG